MNPLVSVIVVNHNRAGLLQECLASLLRQTYDPYEIVVVDNGSWDDSLEVVGSFRHERIRLMALDRNRGFAAGNNAGIREAGGDLIALLNNDAVADEQWLAKLVRPMMTLSAVGMCASKILFFQTDVIDKAGHLMYPDGQNRGRGTGERDQGQYDRLEETLFPDGCAALYRKSLLEQVGGFDEGFFAYGDDADLGMRARWMGWRCVYVPDAVVYHHHSATLGRFSPHKVYWVERNRFWLAVKSFPWPLLAANPVFTMYRWMWNLVAAVAGRGPAGNFRRQASLGELFVTLGRAYRDGFRQLGPVLKSRRQLRRSRRISDLDFYRLLLRFRVSARTLSFQDHEPGPGFAHTVGWSSGRNR